MLITPTSRSLVGIPPGGEVDQALGKTGSADYAVGWQASGYGAGFHAPMLSGLWYCNAYIGFTSVNYAVPANTISYLPIWLDSSISVQAVGLYVNTVGSAVCNWAFYNTNPATALPGTSIITTGPTIPTSSTGPSSVSANFDLPSGWVWAALMVTGASLTLSCISQGTATTASPTAVRVPYGLTSFTANGLPGYVQASATTFTDNPTGLTNQTFVGVPTFYFRIA